MVRPLTRRQHDVLRAIQEARLETGLAPTLEELGQRFGVNRVSAYGHVKALLKKGYLRNRTPGASRALDLTPAGHAALEPCLPFQPDPVATPQPAAGGSPPLLPLLGRIAAGAPLEAVEDRQEVALHDYLGLADDHYLLEVRGDSMIGDNIQEGDLVLVRRNRPPRDGDIVVAILEGEEATLKRLYQEEAGWRLQPANPRLQPRFVEHLEIRGVVTGVLRRF